MNEILSLIESFASHINLGGDIQACESLLDKLISLAQAVEKSLASNNPPASN